MNHINPLITCIIPTYNRAAVVCQAIESIVSQTFQNWELIIVDDQSTDSTWEVITNYEKRDKRIRCFKNPNKGANYARNIGIENAMGKYVAFLDDDDLSLPHRFKSQSEALHRSGYRFIVSWFEVRDRKTGKLKKIDKTNLKGAGAGFPSRWMIEKSLLEEVGGFNPEMIAMQEIELSYRIAVKYTFAHHDDVVTTMFNTPDSTSTGKRAVRGKIQLLEEVGHLMHPLERSWWALTIVQGLSKAGKSKKTINQYREKVIENSSICAYCFIAKIFMNLQRFDNKIMRKINNKLFGKLLKLVFPRLVRHAILK